MVTQNKENQSSSMAPVFIMIAASLWAVDALFRTQLTYSIPSSSIVFFGHLLGFLILSPIFFKNLKSIRALRLPDWVNLVTMTVVSSVLGTIFFTQALAKSFSEFDFVTPILLQKLQPIFVVALSAVFLKEKITKKFVLLAIIALFGSYLMSFGLTPVKLSLQGKELVVILALGATFCWGAGTIMSKKVLKVLHFPVATALRFLLAIPIALIFAYTLNQTYDFTKLGFDQIWRFIVIASITGGAGALILYYKGLQKTEAKISTFAELMYPIISIFIAITALNPYGKPQSLTIEQIVGIIILLISIVLISFERKNVKEDK